MLSDITIGQYFPGSSILHRLDPRTKVVLLFFYLILIFLCKSAISYAIVTVLTVTLMVLSKVPMRMVAVREMLQLNPCHTFTFPFQSIATLYRRLMVNTNGKTS